ncbi:MAG: uncharacterized protein K0R25_244 [Rickettsiaceae bacterium]|jgi:hypothetical protein|nr:uncharacterized protein [Rickettsiaceae bacterium]
MYHIFLTIAIAVGQHQINEIKSSPVQEPKIPQNIALPEDPTKTPAKKEEDIILQLEQQKKVEEASTKPDLESLGLDQMDFLSTKDDKQDVASKDLAPPSKEVEKKNPDQLMVAENKPGIDKTPLEQTLSKVVDDIKTSEIAKKPVEKVKEIIGKELDKKDSEANKSNDKPKEAPPAVIAPAATKPSIAKDEKKKTDSAPPSTSAITKNDSVKKNNIAKNTTKDSESVTAKEQKKSAKKKEKVIYAENYSKPLNKKAQDLKVKNLEKKYLQKNLDGEIEAKNHYEAIRMIVTEEKVPDNKFATSDEVPPPLLNRFRGDENKHHPLIMSNSEKVELMFKAIAENKIDWFNALFALVKDANIKNSAGESLLTFAVLMRRYDAVSSLLSKGADPDLSNDLGYTPLNIAIEMGDYKAVSILVEMGAKVDLVDNLGRTYLMQSSRVGSLPITDLLVSKGIDVNATDRNGTTALAIAYKHKKDIIAKYLLKHGAKSFIKKGYEEDESSMIDDLFNKWR